MVIWCGITFVAITSTLGLYFAKGLHAIEAIVIIGPFSDLHLTFFSVAISWVLLGALIVLLLLKKINSRNFLTLAGFFIISLLYVNLLRERFLYGDVKEYIKAAASLYFDKAMPARYLYPPFWATLLQPLTPLGHRIIFDVMWLLNLVSLFGFYFLLQRVLQKYEFSERLAALTTFAFMVVNVPILRTLGYVQVNLHVTNLILLALLFYPRLRWGSALALSLAVQMKISPIVLVLAFILEKDIRWLVWFVTFTAAVTASTIIINGTGPYHDLLFNLQRIYGADTFSFRDTSIDSLIHTVASLSGSGVEWTNHAVLICKGVVTAGALWIVALSVRRHLFYSGSNQGSVVFNAIPTLLVLMMIASPLVWEHHPVFVALSYLVILKGLSRLDDWLLFGFAYYLEFLVPTFDFFPWSYGRLISPLMWLVLAGRLSKYRWPSEPFLKVNDWVADLKLPQLHLS